MTGLRMGVDGRRRAAWLLIAAVTLLFPVGVYTLEVGYGVVSAQVSEKMPFIETVSEILELDWWEILFTLFYFGLIGLINRTSERISPSREGGRYFLAGCVSALLLVGEVIAYLALTGHPEIPYVLRHILLCVAVAQFSFTLAMANSFRIHGRLAMLFRKKCAALFAATNAEGQSVMMAAVITRQPLIGPDGALDERNLAGMLGEVCARFPQYAAMPGKTVVPCRLEHLSAVYDTQIEVEPTATGTLRLTRTSFRNGETRAVPMDIVNSLRRIEYQWRRENGTV